MRQDKTFLKAVLTWSVEGCIEWHQHGLQIPESVKAATAALFAHNDFLNTFISERCIRDKAGEVSISDFRFEYEDWCRNEGEDPSRGRNFNNMMRERGFDQKSTRFEQGVVKAWHGIWLKDPSRQHYTSLMGHIKKEPAMAGIRGKPATKAKTIGDILDEAEPLFDFTEDEFTEVG